MAATRKIAAINFTDFSGGVNSVESPVMIKPNQVDPETIGFVLKKSGFVRAPGAQGLTASDVYSTYLRLMTFYRQYTTTEKLISVSNGHLYDNSLVDGSLTDLYNMTGTGAAWMAEAYSKAFVCNGSAVIKLENATAYRVGIDAPSGVTAAASAGAGLPDGAYSVYASYARRVGSANVLYGKGQLVGTVTLGSGNNRITVSMANSSDSQVGNKIIWIKSPTEAVHYFFYETTNNSTTSFIISGTGAKSTSLVYESDALNNGLPPNGTFIYSFANRLWLISGNTFYYSKASFNEYDLEVFPAANFRTTPYNLTGIFSIGNNLYFNTDSGILALPNADISALAYLIEPRWNFKYMRTVDRWNNGVIGLTTDGVRFFDGEKFGSVDLSYYIKTDIDRLYNDTDGNFEPCGYVYRNDIRSEYHLMWYDTQVNAVTNSKHAVLNLDTCNAIGITGAFSPDDANIAWEYHNHSGNFAAISRNTNDVYIAQQHETAPKVYLLSKTTNAAKYMYDITGALLTEDTVTRAFFRSREVLPQLDGKIWIKRVYVLAKNSLPFSVQFGIGDRFTIESTVHTLNGGITGGLVWDSGRWDADSWPADNAFKVRLLGDDSLWGGTAWVKVWTEENDITFKILSIMMMIEIETGNFL